MRVRILGCGTSSGVPRVGNDWGACDPANPKNRRRRVSILVEEGDSRILVDTGPDLREQLLDADVADVAALLWTHDHADHCHGIDDLRQISHATGRPVPLHARGDVLDRLAARFAYGFDGSPVYPAMLSRQVIKDEMALGEARLRFVDQPHGGINSLGIRADERDQSLVYAIDFHDLTPDMAVMYDKADVWISDCLRQRPHPTHAHLDAVLGWARELRVGQLWLTHLDNSMDYATLRAALPDWAAPAHDGQEITL